MLLAADQASERVLVLDAANPTWQHGMQPMRAARSASWSWSPLDHSGLSRLSPKRSWNNVSEAKYRLWEGEHWVLTCASGGMAAMVSLTTGSVRWATRTDANAHSVEVLPNGNVAVAASTQDFVRIYTASQSSRSAHYSQFHLPGAHGLQWDQTRELLWAAGDTRLVALRVSGTASRPRIHLVRSVALPSRGGHDVNAVASSPGLLWVTTESHVYQYSVASKAFVAYTGEQEIDEPGVKSISDDPVSGQVLTVAPDGENPCQWCTSRVAFHLPDGIQGITKSSLYKARWMPAVLAAADGRDRSASLPPG
ncbi:DUF6528 family protein [Streptacidiphilus neutrinimicus]|uniref:DUF6528 family protein n=1 Tax=Streptacidiphilus neutrinimicus TaxID=105420 RepID=UPI000694FB6F|nr:DUF6528 family protein [Streptacidiphilus neutrinimicus]